MARPTDRERDELSDAVIELRRRLGETQQEFAARLGMALASVARYETSRRPRGEVLLVLERVAKNAGEHELALVFRRALSLEMDWANEPAQPVWAGVVREIVRNDRLCDGWPGIAQALVLEIEKLIALAKSGTQIESVLKPQGAAIANLESYLIEARYALEGSAEKLLNKLADERLTEHPEETHEQAFAAALVKHPELYIKYRQERADAARGTQFAPSLALHGTRQHTETLRKKSNKPRISKRGKK